MSIPVKSWDMSVGPVGEYLMQENGALNRELAKMVKLTARLTNEKIDARHQNTVLAAEYERQLTNIRIQLNFARQENNHLRIRAERANLKKRHALTMAQAVNRQNKRFQELAASNGYRFRFRPIPSAFMTFVEEETEDETEVDETDNEL